MKSDTNVSTPIIIASALIALFIAAKSYYQHRRYEDMQMQIEDCLAAGKTPSWSAAPESRAAPIKCN